MTRDDIIRMAREAGCEVYEGEDIAPALVRFAALVAAAERARIITMLREMHEQARNQHNYYAYAANLIEAME